MKYLTLLLLLFSVSACCDQEQDEYDKAFAKHPGLKGTSILNRCVELAVKGWEVKDKECLNHIAHPKYKRGQPLRVKTDTYYGKCVFEVYYANWNGVLNEPSYVGELTCNGKVVDSESNLRYNGKLLKDYHREEEK